MYVLNFFEDLYQNKFDMSESFSYNDPVNEIC